MFVYIFYDLQCPALFTKYPTKQVGRSSFQTLRPCNTNHSEAAEFTKM